MFTVRQIAWIGREVHRQKADPTFVAHMARGVLTASSILRENMTFETISHINALVLGLSESELRKTPVTFANGGTSAYLGVMSWWDSSTSQDVPNMCLAIEPLIFLLPDEDVDEWIKQFLWIHPYTDGNWRTAAILRNWFLGTLDKPTDLPDYGW